MRFKPNVNMKFEIQDSRRLKYFFELMWFMRMPNRDTAFNSRKSIQTSWYLRGIHDQWFLLHE